MKPSVILYKALPDDLLQRLQEHFTVHQVANLSPQTVEQNAAIFAEAEGLLGSNENVDAALLEKMPKLRATSTISVGYDNFDVDALTARKILLMHTPTVLTETVADTLMALVLSTARRVVEVAERVKAGEWTASIGPDWYGTDVHHKTLGIVGMGRIGMALAQRAHDCVEMHLWMSCANLKMGILKRRVECYFQNLRQHLKNLGQNIHCI